MKSLVLVVTVLVLGSLTFAQGAANPARTLNSRPRRHLPGTCRARRAPQSVGDLGRVRSPSRPARMTPL